MTKRTVLTVIKVAAGIAAVVFWLMPLGTGTQVLLFIGSMVVMLVCFAVSSSLDEESTGYWPDKPRD